MRLTNEPQDVDRHNWFYEQKDGILVVHEAVDGNGTWTKTDQFIIPWRELKISMKPLANPNVWGMGNEWFVKRAMDIAYTRHATEMRRDGKTPYIEHVQRVALTMRSHRNGRLEAVAWLHDVIENTGPIDWPREKFPVSIEAAVEAMTKHPSEPYLDYIIRVAQNPLARLVKLADIFDNLSDAPTAKQCAWYFRAIPMLVLPILGGTEDVRSSAIAATQESKEAPNEPVARKEKE